MEICATRLTQIKNTINIFNTVIQGTIDPTFRIVNPNGGVVLLRLNNILDKLSDLYEGISNERLVDFCVCNAYRCYQADWEQVKKRGIRYFFSDISIESYQKQTYKRMYYIDKWLGEKCSRKYLLSLISDRKQHPLYKFIYPEYEEFTKHRKLNTDVGYMICGQSTMGWTPFSRICNQCTFSDKCQDRTKTIYPELFRIRKEEFDATKQTKSAE